MSKQGDLVFTSVSPHGGVSMKGQTGARTADGGPLEGLVAVAPGGPVTLGCKRKRPSSGRIKTKSLLVI